MSAYTANALVGPAVDDPSLTTSATASLTARQESDPRHDNYSSSMTSAQQARMPIVCVEGESNPRTDSQSNVDDHQSHLTGHLNWWGYMILWKS